MKKLMSLGSVIAAALACLAVAAPAKATDNIFCYQIVSPGTPCPSYYGGNGNIYVNQRTSWGTTINYDCGIDLYEAMVHYVDPHSGGPGAVKYGDSGKCYLNKQFPHNTQTLAGYAQQFDNSSWTLVGKAAF